MEGVTTFSNSTLEFWTCARAHTEYRAAEKCSKRSYEVQIGNDKLTKYYFTNLTYHFFYIVDMPERFD